MSFVDFIQNAPPVVAILKRELSDGVIDVIAAWQDSIEESGANELFLDYFKRNHPILIDQMYLSPGDLARNIDVVCLVDVFHSFYLK